MDRETVTLTPQQREIADDLLEKVRADEVVHPLDVVDRWEPVTNYVENYGSHSEVSISDRRRAMIPVSRIAGVSNNRADGIMPRRLEHVLEWLLAGEYRKYPDSPPQLERIDDRYNVAVDGTHRTLAHKALGIREMHAIFVEVQSP